MPIRMATINGMLPKKDTNCWGEYGKVEINAPSAGM